MPCLQVAYTGHRLSRDSRVRRARGKILESISRVQPRPNGEGDAGSRLSGRMLPKERTDDGKNRRLSFEHLKWV